MRRAQPAAPDPSGRCCGTGRTRKAPRIPVGELTRGTCAGPHVPGCPSETIASGAQCDALAVSKDERSGCVTPPSGRRRQAHERLPQYSALRVFLFFVARCASLLSFCVTCNMERPCWLGVPEERFFQTQLLPAIARILEDVCASNDKVGAVWWRRQRRERREDRERDFMHNRDVPKSMRRERQRTEPSVLFVCSVTRGPRNSPA